MTQAGFSPRGSGYLATSTAREVLSGVDLTGKVAIVTGGYSGIGLATTRALHDAGAYIVVPARRPDVAKRNLADLSRVKTEYLDLGDPESIENFACGFVKEGSCLDILINNAGVMATPQIIDSRGIESQFSINHLGHFHLTLKIWPALVKANGARVVCVSSRAHQRSPVHFDDVSCLFRPYDKWKAYGQSKTANILFACELDRLGINSEIRAFAVHPGPVITELLRHLEDQDLEQLGLVRAGGEEPISVARAERALGPFKTAEQAAATSVWCATSQFLEGHGGVYCQDVNIAPICELQNDCGGVRRYAIDESNARKLWNLSEELCNTGL